MFRNQYDSDVTVWSPQGRLHQVEYAMEAVKLGSATVGLKNSDFAVLVALRRAASDLSSSQRKIIPIDDHLGISIAGITADARVLSNYLRTECLNYKYAYGARYPVARLISMLGNKMQVTTQRYDRRPYGVGLLVAGYDERGPHIFQVDPSANFFNCKAMSIGSRSQSARTYLERNISAKGRDFVCTKDELICHGIQAIRGSLPNDEDSESPLLNISIAIVGKDQPFKILDDVESKKYLDMAKKLPAPPAPADDDVPATGGDDDDKPDDSPPDPQVLVATMER
ncbi:PREDICTED: proteasome subunit alpha type-1 [Rhagoletis zephyria]|uniref:proteasome subunit alpha type-1 n=1 Tax=Rhagoletis zephyria TaxID=28612 RepID=UPI00081192A4|nr:PREDICTED: proteasome subunit alpha type-1 [Rhagoletis zephyria]XP_036321398.1 proteasome subunit alpha type-1 [Rhagoletis pomonella]